MSNDVVFLAKTLRRLDKAENYISYLSEDYLPSMVKKLNKNFKLSRRSSFCFGVGCLVLTWYAWNGFNKLQKENDDLKERLEALEDRLDEHIDPEWKTSNFDTEE